MKKRILFFAPHVPDRSPSQRYRFEQYLRYLSQEKFEWRISWLLSLKAGYLLYGKGNTAAKIWIVFVSLLKRLRDVVRAHRYDFVYIHKSGFFFGAFIERMLTWTGAKVIYDFDDAIWLVDRNPNQGVFNKLKSPNKTAKVISFSNLVISGNKYLSNYAQQFNPHVTIIPSTISLEKYNVTKQSHEKVCIGWTGSFSTIKHFETVLPALEIIKEKYGDRVYFKLIGEPGYVHEALGIKGVKWSSETEAEDLSELDIGLMPLPDNQWTQGKCAMKGLQYMALSIPTIMSPVGVNADIVEDGRNGFLATTTEEWVSKLSLLIEDVELRKNMGAAGRETVEKDFSVEANKDKWLSVFT